MSDIGIFMQVQGGDVRVESNDLVRDDGLETAVTVSLFLDKRAAPEQLPAGFSRDDLRGYWGEVANEEQGDHEGSWLWLLDREKTLPEVLGKARDYSIDALQWMITDSIADRVVANASFIEDRIGWMYLEVQIYRPDGNNLTFKYNFEWSAQAAKRVA